MPLAADVDLSQYADKKVTVIRNLPEPNEEGATSVEVEGVVQVANDIGLLLKPKGQVKFELIAKDEIEEVYIAREAQRNLKRSKLNLVKLGQARRHLLERHGIQLSWVNNATEEQAFEYHESLDHEQLDLGHIHVDKGAEKEKGSESDESDEE